MNDTLFWRIVWKEYRVQRGFWLSMVVLTLLLQLLVLWAQPERMDQVGMARGLFGVGLGLAAFYALGSAATLFATEHETGTYDFQRVLPVTALRVFAGKLTYALASTAALFAAVWMLALVLARFQLPDTYFHSLLWVLWGFGALELVLWGTLFSLLLKRPLIAVILGVTCASVTLGVLSGETAEFLALDVYLKALPARLVVIALLAAADVWLGARWFRERLLASSRRRSAVATKETIDAAFAPVATVQTRTMLRRLVWQDFRQSAGIIAALIAMLLPTVLFLWGRAVFRLEPDRGPQLGFGGVVLIFGTFAAILSAPLLGASVFMADQAGSHFRFFADRGIRPRLVWLSRQLRGVAVLALGLALVLPPILVLVFARGEGPRGEERFLVIAALLGYAVLAYACGQLCSMLARSGILAAAFGTVLSFALCAWAGMANVFGLSWFWSVAPLPIAFLVATWVHAPDWVLERTDWRARLKPTLVVLVPLLAILAAIPPVRIYEYPLVDPGFSVEELTRPATEEEKQTMALYQRAVDLMRQAEAQRPRVAAPGVSGAPPEADAGATPKKTADNTAWLKATEQTFAVALEASRRPPSRFYLSDRSKPGPGDESNLGQLVLLQAQWLESQGKLDAALEHYLAAIRIANHARRWAPWTGMEPEIYSALAAWAARPGQTSQRIVGAIRAMEKDRQNAPSFCDAFKFEYVVLQRIIQDYREGLKEVGVNPNETEQFGAFLRWFPWEKARALRLLNILIAREYAQCQQAEADLAAGKAVQVPADRNALDLSPRGDPADSLVALRAPMANLHVNLKVNEEIRRRATLLILALEAWKLDHGSLPEKLEDLKGKYLDQMPVDPATGVEFGYAPKGFPHPLQWSAPGSATLEETKPGQPFLWSGVRAVGYSVMAAMGPAGLPGMGVSSSGMPGAAEPSAPPQAPASPIAAVEVWRNVWVFLIP